MLHVDLDEFVAAVEILRRPELRGQPVVVGGRGDPTKRGVVSTANYEARRYGVGSGTPLRVALRKCPDAVFLPVDRAAYDAASERVMRVLARFTAALEVWGWDEAFLAIEDDPLSAAQAIRAAVLEETGLSCSVGIGDNKARMVDELAAELSDENRLALGVTVKVRFAPFVTRSRSRRVNPSTIDAQELVAAAKVALARFEFDRPVRLVGVKLDLD